MTARPQNTAQNHPKSPEFTLLGEFEDEGVIQQSNNRRRYGNKQQKMDRLAC